MKMRVLGALLLVAGLPACEAVTAPGIDGNCIFGFARIDGLIYHRADRIDGESPFVPGDLVATVTRKRKCQDQELYYGDGTVDAPEPWADGDADFLEPGTPVFEVPGYPPSERLAAQTDAGWIELEATNPVTGFIEDGIQVLLSLGASRVSPTDTLTARLVYRVTGIDSATLTSGYGCPAFAGVYQDKTRIPFPATDYGCTAAITTWPLTADNPITREWTLELGPDGTQLDPGLYRFEAQLNTHAGRTLALEFEVR